MTVTLSQTAPWATGFNPRLHNGYRTRFTQVGDRFFKVYAEDLNGIWWIEEIDADGDTVVKYRPPVNSPEFTDAHAWVFGFQAVAMRLSEARDKIEKECA